MKFKEHHITSIYIQFCKCVPDAIRLIELGYWPATPAQPIFVFTRSFMDWMEALLLECQVSTQDFSSAVEMIVKENFTEVIMHFRTSTS